MAFNLIVSVRHAHSFIIELDQNSKGKRTELYYFIVPWENERMETQKAK